MPHYVNRAMAYEVVKIRTSDGLELDRTIVVAVDDEQALTTGQQFLEDIAVCDAIVHYEVVTMTQYTVLHSIGKFNGCTAHDNLAAAEAEFEHQRSRRNVVEVVLSEDTDDGPVIIQSWDATNN